MRIAFAARCAVVVVLAGLVGGATASSAPEPEEMSLGLQVYKDMVAHHYLLPPTSPEAKELAPIAKQLSAVGDKLYGAPFHFYVHVSTVPNAYVVYGPWVYVNRGLLQFADNREQVAGVLCHEMSHALHRDGTNDDAKARAYDMHTKAFILKAEKVMHGHFSGTISGMSQFGENFIWLHHSRAQEERADLAGADLCASAKSNPWGLVWMFQKFQNQAPSHGLSWFSDHPSTKTRIAALEKHFKQNPKVFSGWSKSETTATPLR